MYKQICTNRWFIWAIVFIVTAGVSLWCFTEHINITMDTDLTNDSVIFAVVFHKKLADNRAVNKHCNTNEDCIYTCGCGAINKNSTCDDKGAIYDCVDHFVSCEKNICTLGEEVIREN